MQNPSEAAAGIRQLADRLLPGGFNELALRAAAVQSYASHLGGYEEDFKPLQAIYNNMLWLQGDLKAPQSAGLVMALQRGPAHPDAAAWLRKTDEALTAAAWQALKTGYQRARVLDELFKPTDLDVLLGPHPKKAEIKSPGGPYMYMLRSRSSKAGESTEDMGLRGFDSSLKRLKASQPDMTSPLFKAWFGTQGQIIFKGWDYLKVPYIFFFEGDDPKFSNIYEDLDASRWEEPVTEQELNEATMPQPGAEDANYYAVIGPAYKTDIIYAVMPEGQLQGYINRLASSAELQDMADMQLGINRLSQPIFIRSDQHDLSKDLATGVHDFGMSTSIRKWAERFAGKALIGTPAGAPHLSIPPGLTPIMAPPPPVLSPSSPRSASPAAAEQKVTDKVSNFMETRGAAPSMGDLIVMRVPYPKEGGTTGTMTVIARHIAGVEIGLIDADLYEEISAWADWVDSVLREKKSLSRSDGEGELRNYALEATAIKVYKSGKLEAS